MLTLTGPLAAYFQAVEVSDNDWRLEATAVPPPGSYAYTLTEAQDGYDNSPRSTSGAVTVEQAAGEGAIVATPDSTVVAPANSAGVSAGPSIPIGAPVWTRPLDPGDCWPYAFSFDKNLMTGRRIAEIASIRMSAQGAALGVTIERDAPYAPIIDQDDARKVQVYFSVDAASQEALQFDGEGIKIPIAFRVWDDATPPNRIEQSGVLVVRQK